MNPFRSRTWQIGATLVILASLGTYVYLRFFGPSHPLPKLIRADQHRVATLGDYARYIRAPTAFYKEYSGAALSFDCERIRDEFVQLTQSIVSPELSTSEETIVWRQGRALNLGDPSVSGAEAFAAWKRQVTKLATVQHPREDGHYATLLQALFTSVRIHGRDADEEFGVETRSGSASDACG